MKNEIVKLLRSRELCTTNIHETTLSKCPTCNHIITEHYLTEKACLSIVELLEEQGVIECDEEEQEINIGDVVIIHDGSFNVSFRNGIMLEEHGCDFVGKLFKVGAISFSNSFPTRNPDKFKDITNNLLLRDMCDTGHIVYTSMICCRPFIAK